MTTLDQNREAISKATRVFEWFIACLVGVAIGLLWAYSISNPITKAKKPHIMATTDGLPARIPESDAPIKVLLHYYSDGSVEWQLK